MAQKNDLPTHEVLDEQGNRIGTYVGTRYQDDQPSLLQKYFGIGRRTPATIRSLPQKPKSGLESISELGPVKAGKVDLSNAVRK